MKEMQGINYMELIRKEYLDAVVILVHRRSYCVDDKTIQYVKKSLEKNPDGVFYAQLDSGPKTWIIYNPQKAYTAQLMQAFRGINSRDWEVEVL